MCKAITAETGYECIPASLQQAARMCAGLTMGNFQRQMRAELERQKDTLTKPVYTAFGLRLSDGAADTGHEAIYRDLQRKFPMNADTEKGIACLAVHREAKRDDPHAVGHLTANSYSLSSTAILKMALVASNCNVALIRPQTGVEERTASFDMAFNRVTLKGGKEKWTECTVSVFSGVLDRQFAVFRRCAMGRSISKSCIAPLFFSKWREIWI